VCGSERSLPYFTEGLSYTLNNDQRSYSITGTGNATDLDVIIPAFYNDLPVTSISSSAFSNCTSLASITIPDSVTTIGSSAFSNCTSLESITIPESVTTIGDAAFSSCTSLASITVDENNTAYKDIDGNLYTKDGKTLIQYAIGKTDTSFTIPDGVEVIGGAAFVYCTSLASITIPESVTKIGSYAFCGCKSLASITIPESVTTIGYYAFYDCYRLTDVYYTGGVEDWATISIGDYNSYLTGATIHYNYAAE
jgi:hypothetical protein